MKINAQCQTCFDYCKESKIGTRANLHRTNPPFASILALLNLATKSAKRFV
ncbi:unnamed protein product [Brassica rapa]|uniref:Uncharacterized protein n=2 Tax=Brassica TaxID=3705 RepID=M4EJR9_BRACM|nr:unnamed protein product [Brassica napus]CAG7880119.1 unnamed protein product [Brassica rapa]